MSKAGMAVLAACALGAMAALAGIAARSIPVLQGTAQAAPPAGALRMNGSHPLVPPAQLRLAGEVTPLAAGDALQSVEMRVGSEVVPVSLQGQYFESTLFLMDTDRMVSVEVRSTKGRQASLLGSVSRLAALAGNDGRLDVQEHTALRVSAFTTALMRHIEYALTRWPATDAELDQTTRAVAHDGLSALSHALSKIAAGELPMPAGYQDGYAFSADRNAFKAWPHLPSYQTWSGYLFEEPSGSRVTDLAELPSRMLMLGGLSVTQYPGYTGTTRLLERIDDGSVNFHEDRPLVSPNYAITLDGEGRVVLTPRAPVVHWYERTDPENASIQRTSQGHVLQRVARSGAISVWAVRSDWLDEEMSSPSSPPVPVTEYRVLSGTDLDGWVRTDAWPSTSWQYTLPWICVEPGQLAICGYPLHRLDSWDNTGLTAEQGMPLSADGIPEVPSGSVRFDFAIQNQTRLTIGNGQTETHFWRLQAGTVGRAVVPTIFLSRSRQGATQGETLVGLTPSFLYQFQSYQPSIIQPLGNWRNGYQSAQPPSYVEPDVSVTFSRLADGSSAYSVQGDNGNSVESHRWSMTGFGIYNIRASARYPDGSSRQVDGCTASVIAAGATSCSALVRYFRPITLARGSYYGVEERYQVRYPDLGAAPGQPNRFSINRDYSRLGFQMCESVECIDVFPKFETFATMDGSTSMPSESVRGARVVGKPRRIVARIPLLRPWYETTIEHADSCPVCRDAADGRWAIAGDRDSANEALDDGGRAERSRQDDRSPPPEDSLQPVSLSKEKSWMRPAKMEPKPATPSSSS